MESDTFFSRKYLGCIRTVQIMLSVKFIGGQVNAKH